eukprot:m.406155 g.406155  ORF g.406155 m.406155 type:complete len:144 (+) comp16795_c5_seq4:7843-8274(+)
MVLFLRETYRGCSFFLTLLTSANSYCNCKVSCSPFSWLRQTVRFLDGRPFATTQDTKSSGATSSQVRASVASHDTGIGGQWTDCLFMMPLCPGQTLNKSSWTTDFQGNDSRVRDRYLHMQPPNLSPPEPLFRLQPRHRRERVH